MGASILRAPSKLNLTLEVLQRRADGLHGLRSVMVPIDLCDEVVVEPSGRFEFHCDVEDLRSDNLAERALTMLSLHDAPVRVTLRKSIPTGAGMGGGSSDAAAILLAAQRGIFGKPPAVDYVAVARALGSDVPFFLTQTAALVEGTGERVTALGSVPPWHAVIVKPPASISTAWAYAQIDAHPRESRPRSGSISLQMCEALQGRDFERVVSLMQNNFHDVIAPANAEIGRALQALRSAGASHAMLTGSGSCVFCLVPSAADAASLLAEVSLEPEYRTFTGALISGEAWR
jgi:4-diphosphocytidyl-2-C-methyl-D-erythritol kinase